VGDIPKIRGGLVEFILPHHRPLILGVPHTRAEPCTKCIFVCVHGMKEKKVEQKIDGQNHHTGHKKGRPKKGLKMINPQEFFKKTKKRKLGPLVSDRKLSRPWPF